MAEKRVTVYELSNVELTDTFMKACARAGVSNSGLCIDPSAGADVVEMNYIKGAVLARMDGQKPPFEPETKVKIKEEVVLPEPKHYYHAPDLEGNQTYTIDRVWYDKGKWYLTFLEMGKFSELDAQYLAERFCLVESTAEIAPAVH